MEMMNGELHVPTDLPNERVPSVHSIGGFLGPIAGLDAVEKRKITYPGGNQPADQPVTHRYA
jgi:hypothetical protein